MGLRVGIISANWGAVAHLPAWRAVEGVEVTAICTSRRETAVAAAERFQVARPFWEYDALCADPELDIVDCGTRPNLRLGMVMSALRYGRHVYNGVPFAARLDTARDMREACAASGKVGVVDAFAQWLPAHRLMREIIEGGELGAIFGGSCRFNTALFNAPRPNFPFNWFSEPATGVSALRNMGSHMLHVVMALLGPIADVVADDRLVQREWSFENGETLAPHNNDFANALLRFQSGAILPMQIGWSAACGEGWAIDLLGERGRLSATASENFPTSKGCILRMGKRGGSMEDVSIPQRLTRADGVAVDWNASMPAVFPMALAMRSMVDAIEGRAKAAPDFERGWQVELALEAIRRAAEERRWVSLNEIT
jgi:predicted dehydrogenase